MIAHEKGFKFHAQPQTGAYSCLGLEDGWRYWGGGKAVNGGAVLGGTVEGMV